MPQLRPNFDLAPYTFRGDQLREIAFPLGGIGTGCVSLDGRGGLRDWEIYNRPNKNSLLETTFPTLWCRQDGQAPRALVVQGPRVKNWIGEGNTFWNYGHGQFFKQGDGLPCFDEVEFEGTFPFARVQFRKDDLPLKVSLAAFNPFIPLDIRSSSFPTACLIYTLTNTSDQPVEATLAWNMMNPVGEGRPVPKGEEERATNEYRDGEHCKGILFSNERLGADDPGNGTAALTTDWRDTTYTARWQPGAWFDPIQTFWNEFRETGNLNEASKKETGPRMTGSLGCRVTLQPGESADIPFLISWSFPVAKKYWAGEAEETQPWKPFYTTDWPTALAAAEEFFSRKEELLNRTRSFEDALFESTMPSEVIQSISATASILHSPTVLRLEDGTFWAWEGCSPSEGCCAGTCTHVWNYAQTHAYLFPEMQWNMRKADYKFNFNCGPMGKEGAMDFRMAIPLGAQSTLWHAASDGQLGGIVQLYRDWKLSGDDAAMRELWPSAKRALEFAWVQWDRDRDGLVDGDQHNTYDINFQGPNPLTQFFYLAALKAGAEMAEACGDTSADTYRKLFESGQKLTEERLWNGEFFIQTMDCLAPDAPKYQHGIGCLSDQVFGQLSASIAGLGHLVDGEKIKSTLSAIYRNNFKNPLGDHENLQRVFAMRDETGLLLCSWPNGGRPAYPFVYSDEVWTGIEYQVAVHLALEGMRDEALSIVKGVRERYDGTRRNPWNEFECGSHYARALASYGLLLAFSGLTYSGASRSLASAGSRAYRGFFCTPHGWGIAEARGGTVEFKLVEKCGP
ncbi:MAG: GH116 family glycosyl-hydrolase [Fimbriimonas sp.]